MKNYIVYNSNGEILRTGICPGQMVKIQGENVIEGVASDIEHKIINGEIVRKSEEEIAAIKDKFKPDPQEKLIKKKEREILREMAIEKLKKEGKI